MGQRLTYQELQHQCIIGIFKDIAQPVVVSPADEFNRGIDLSQLNQDITDCQLRCDKVHHFIAYKDWSVQ